LWCEPHLIGWSKMPWSLAEVSHSSSILLENGELMTADSHSLPPSSPRRPSPDQAIQVSATVTGNPKTVIPRLSLSPRSRRSPSPTILVMGDRSLSPRENRSSSQVFARLSLCIDRARESNGISRSNRNCSPTRPPLCAASS
jgi:hypothetical protein